MGSLVAYDGQYDETSAALMTGTGYSKINKTTAHTSAPSLTTYLTGEALSNSFGYAGFAVGFYDQAPSDVSVVTAITLWFYEEHTNLPSFGSDGGIEVGIKYINRTWGSPLVPDVTSGLILLGSQAAGWRSYTFSGLSITKTQLNNLAINFFWETAGDAPSQHLSGKVYSLFADVTYTASAPAGPTVAQAGSGFFAFPP